MKISYQYLKSYLGTNLSQKNLADVFTQVGFECEIDGSIIDFDITPNRGDVLSLMGLAREFYAFQNIRFTDNISKLKVSFAKDKKIINSIDSSGCSNYHLLLIKGLQSIKELDAKKKNFLKKAGIPLIHPLVDLGNYVMLEIGAPMHVFDLDKLNLPISVSFPRNNNINLEVIGGDQKKIQTSSLTICDKSGVQAIAGIIGGQKSSVSKYTSNIAIEAAFFKPEKIANQARLYGLATDASHRFERGIDPTIQKIALERYLLLLDRIACFRTSEGYVLENKLPVKKNISLNVERFNAFSGLALKEQEVIKILKNLGFLISPNNKTKNLKFSIPNYRFDVSIEEDLYEELLRSFGYDNIPAVKPKPGPRKKHFFSNTSSRIKSGLASSGFKELMHMPFVSHKIFNNLNPNSWKPAELKNPINENEPLLRGSLFGSLFSAVNLNVKKGHYSIKVFEFGNVFKKSKHAFEQKTHITGIIYNHEPIKSWNSKESHYDFYSLKADVLKILNMAGIQKITFKPNHASKIFNINAINIYHKSLKIGVLGEIDLLSTDKLIKKPAYGFELYPEAIIPESETWKLKPVSKFPVSSRDINILINRDIIYADVENSVLQGKIKFLKAFNLVNTFEGKEIPNGYLSMTVRFIFQSNSKSLLESDVSLSMKKVLIILQDQFKAKIRA